MTMREQLTERFDKGHLSYSSIKHALGDMKVWEMYMKRELYKESEALRFGTLYDMLLYLMTKTWLVGSTHQGPSSRPNTKNVWLLPQRKLWRQVRRSLQVRTGRRPLP